MWLYKSLHFFWRFILQYLLMSAWNKCTRVETYLRAFRRPSTLSAGWSFRTLMQPFIWNDQSPRFSKVKKQQYSKLCCVRIGLNMSALHLFWRTCWRRRWGGRGHRGWWPRPWLSCRTRPCPRCWNDSSNLWEHNKIRSYRIGFEKPLEHNGKKWIYEVFCIFSLANLVNSRCLQHDFTDAGHGAQTICRVLQWKSLVLKNKNKPKNQQAMHLFVILTLLKHFLYGLL